MLACIQVEADTEGLQVALRELFEEAYLRDAIGGVMAEASEATRSRAMEELPARSLSPGYYDRVSYLLDLASAIECGAAYSAAMLVRPDVRGLQLVRRAKAEFEVEHFPCAACGVRQDNRYAMQCRKCGQKFGRQS